jgi:hypothetical protein
LAVGDCCQSKRTPFFFLMHRRLRLDGQGPGDDAPGAPTHCHRGLEVQEPGSGSRCTRGALTSTPSQSRPRQRPSVGVGGFFRWGLSQGTGVQVLAAAAVVCVLAALAPTARAACPNSCVGRGVCLPDNTCQCYDGFGGADCSRREFVCLFVWVSFQCSDPRPRRSLRLRLVAPYYIMM